MWKTKRDTRIAFTSFEFMMDTLEIIRAVYEGKFRRGKRSESEKIGTVKLTQKTRQRKGVCLYPVSPGSFGSKVYRDNIGKCQVNE